MTATMGRFASLFIALLTIAFPKHAQARLELSKYFGFPVVEQEERLLQQLQQAVTVNKYSCSDDVQIFCSPRDEFIFLSFGNGIFTSSGPEADILEAILLLDQFQIYVEVFEQANRRLCAMNNEYQENSVETTFREIAAYYPHPIFGFGMEQDKCLTDILQGENPNGSMFAAPILSQQCKESANTVAQLYMQVGEVAEIQDNFEMCLRFGLAFFLLLVFVTFWAWVDIKSKDDNEEHRSEEGFEYVVLEEKEDENERVYIGVPLRVI